MPVILHDDSIDDLLGRPAATAVAPPADFVPAVERVFSEPCPKCRGSGRFYGWSGRDVGACHTCKGTGKQTFKTAPESRAKAAGRRAVKRTNKAAKDAAWRDAHKAELVWLAATTERQQERAHKGAKVWDFPVELSEKLAQFGVLTYGQLEAVRKCMARDAERAKEREAAAPTVVNTNKLADAFANARGAAAEAREGLKWLVLRLDTFTFTDARARGDWPAAIFVREGDTKLGRIVAGKFLRSRDCDDATEARVLAAIADPAAAATAYGQRNGVCSCCGRELTNAESRKRGIGPICAEKYGF
jgi:hypothetical protein